MSPPDRPWVFPMPPRDASEQARWDAEQQRRLALQAGAITSVGPSDMPGPLLIAACVVGGATISWLEGGAT
jgi:hypothetical protein